MFCFIAFNQIPNPEHAGAPREGLFSATSILPKLYLAAPAYSVEAEMRNYKRTACLCPDQWASAATCHGVLRRSQ